MLFSYIFYAAWNLKLLSLIIIATAVAFVVGLAANGSKIDRKQLLQMASLISLGCSVALVPSIASSLNLYLTCLSTIPLLILFSIVVNPLSPERRAYLAVITGIFLNLSLLGFFKYYHFFVSSILDGAAIVGYQVDYVVPNILLPVGISFFTFQKLAYIIDVKRGLVTPERNLIRFSAFVAFFPQLVAGPIERANSLLSQFYQKRVVRRDNLTTGSLLFLWGMFEKTFVADNLASLSALSFNEPGRQNSGVLMVGLLAFAFQILCDFSGYSNMARGLARVLGIELMVNFNVPYISRSPSDFWARWHISLSSWLRDYLYIPLGGNRGSSIITYRNLFLTMLLGGLWHGASWTFVAWGAFHGSILIIYRLMRVDQLLNHEYKSRATKLSIDLFFAFTMFGLTLFGWLLFRAKSMYQVLLYIEGILSVDKITYGQWDHLWIYITPIILASVMQVKFRDTEFIRHLHPIFKLNVILLLACSILFASPDVNVPFIYFDF